MSNSLQAYNVMASHTPTDTPHQSIKSVHTHLFNHVAQANQAQHESLVDRGANGGLVGSDERILSKTSRKCTVTGIDQHQINGLKQDTYGDLLETGSDEDQVVKYNVALLANDSVSLEKKQ